MHLANEIAQLRQAIGFVFSLQCIRILHTSDTRLVHMLLVRRRRRRAPSFWLFAQRIKISFSVHAQCVGCLCGASPWTISMMSVGLAATPASCTACGRSMIPAGCRSCRSKCLSSWSKGPFYTAKPETSHLLSLIGPTPLGTPERFQLCIGLETLQPQTACPMNNLSYSIWSSF